MGFLREAVPSRDRLVDAASGIRRLTAPNSGAMTYHGTNSYIIEYNGGLAIVDPGPAQALGHVTHLIEACHGRLKAVLITHGHQDHFGALAYFPQDARVPVYSFESSFNPDWHPENLLKEGDRFGAYEVIHCPVMRPIISALPVLTGLF